MKTIIICDQNKELIDLLKANIPEGKQPSGVHLTFVHGDVVELHEQTANSRIVTASNPQFSPDGGLDYTLAKKYSWENTKEFMFTNDLFYVVSVDKNRTATTELVKRALVGVFGYAHKFIPIVTGIGTAIGGLSMNDYLNIVSLILRSANLSSANLSFANLRYANLSSASLMSANLMSANLSSANLSFANLRYANLSSASLMSANLRSANLRFTNLMSANLRFTNLMSANLSSANLSFANLMSANLSSANLSFANLRYANLSSASLMSANLRSANLSSANLMSAENIETVLHDEITTHFALCCPEEGEFTAFKKAGGCIVTLKIPAHAQRSSATSRKCRASEALVIDIVDKKGEKKKEATSNYDPDIVYRVGEVITPKEPFEQDRWVECASGIHFFITRREAEIYNQ